MTKKKRTSDLFLSTPSARRATSAHRFTPVRQTISIHALREEGDELDDKGEVKDAKFLSTPSARRATRSTRPAAAELRHFYPRPPRGGRPAVLCAGQVSPAISIHALREEGDYNFFTVCRPYGEFLSTPSARRATQSAAQPHLCPCISIHALREEGDKEDWELFKEQFISIHALREEGDFIPLELNVVVQLFLSTPSARRATHRVSGKVQGAGYFYPRPPRGGRRSRCWKKSESTSFLSTPSARRATWAITRWEQSNKISIHALREEGDKHKEKVMEELTYFYPRPPRGGRLYKTDSIQLENDFYPRPPRGGRPANPKAKAEATTFLSTPSARRATSGHIVPLPDR